MFEQIWWEGTTLLQNGAWQATKFAAQFSGMNWPCEPSAMLKTSPTAPRLFFLQHKASELRKTIDALQYVLNLCHI